MIVLVQWKRKRWKVISRLFQSLGAVGLRTSFIDVGAFFNTDMVNTETFLGVVLVMHNTSPRRE